MICTFYSFKGGVGRSMALANVAELFYARGLNVLMIDFDLEAPGLERYFAVTPQKLAEIETSRGVIDMVLSFRKLQSYETESRQPGLPGGDGGEGPLSVEPVENFIVKIYDDPTRPGKLGLLPSGSRKDPDFAEYAKRVLSVDWADFYLKRGGERFFDWFRQELNRTAPGGWDVVLIDSRTGVTEVGGVCTHHLPDLVVSFVATNVQNLEGTKMMAQSLSNPALIEKTRKGAPLQLLFVPSRVEPSEEDKHDEFARRFDEDLRQWFPKNMEPEKTWFLDLRLLYVPAYSYLERVAVRETERASKVDLIEAYTRLASRIAQLAGSGRLFAAYQAATGPVSNLPPRKPHFAGREEDLKRIGAALAHNTPVVICGPAGIGKGCLAIEYAARARNEYATILWTCAKDESELQAGLEEIARLLQLPSDSGRVRDRVKKWLETNDRWLLIIDDAADASLLQSFLPTGIRGHIILTSRVHGFTPLSARPVLLGLLTAAEAVEFFARRLGRQELGADEQLAARALAEELGYLPLALDQAAAYIATRQTRIADYLTSYRKRRMRLLDQQTVSSAGRELSLTVVFETALAELASSPASADVLRFSSMLAPNDIPIEMLACCGPALTEDLHKALEAAADDPLAIDEILEPLTRSSLINRNSASHSFSLHPLLQEYVRSRMTEEELGVWRGRILHALTEAMPAVSTKNLVVWSRAFPHLVVMLTAAGSAAPARLLARTGALARARGDFPAAEPLLTLALKLSRETSNQADMVEAGQWLADLRLAQGNLEEAWNLSHEALDLAVKSGQGEDAAVPLLTIGARISWSRGELDKAAVMYEQILQMEPANSEYMVNAAIGLGSIRYSTGRAEEGERLLHRAVEIGEREGGLILAPALYTQARIQLSRAIADGSTPARGVEASLRRVLSLQDESFGPEHPQSIPTLQLLGLFHLLVRDARTAEGLLRRTLEMQRRVLPAGDPSLAETLGYLAVAAAAASRPDDATALLSEGLQMLETGPSSAWMASAFREQTLAVAKLAGVVLTSKEVA